MKILFLFSGVAKGGSNISTLELIKVLIKNKIEVKIVLHKFGVLSNLLDKNNIKYVVLQKDHFDSSLSLISNLTIIIKNFLFGVSFLRFNKDYIIHFNEYRVSFTWIIPLLLSKNLFILHARNIYFKSFLLNLICKRSSKIIAISNYVMNSFPNKFTKKISKINNPILISHPQINKTKFLKKFKLEETSKIIIFISNFNKKKRPLFFVDVASKILEIRKDCQFLMFGHYTKKFEYELIKKINSYQLKSNLRYFKFNENINDILYHSNIVILPGINEGSGRVALEAFYNKTIVIASKSGGYKESVIDNHTGFLCESDNIDEFVSKTNYILNNLKQVEQKVLKNAYEFVEKEFSIDLHFKKINALYEDIQSVREKQ